jgi:hypothetical protein
MRHSKKIIGLLLCALLISFAATIGVAAEEQIIQGTVEQSDAGLVIVAEDGQYLVVGQDLSDMVGKTVVVTGTIAESQEGKTITVTTVQEIE